MREAKDRMMNPWASAPEFRETTHGGEQVLTHFTTLHICGRRISSTVSGCF